MKQTIVFSLGGSLVYPKELDLVYLKQIRKIILDFVKKDNTAIIVVGGGNLARQFNKVALELNKNLSRIELDWQGIRATKMNAELVRSSFGKSAYYKVIGKPHEEILEKKKIYVAGGWRPGASSDNMAVELAKAFGASTVVNLTNIDYVYTADPKKDSKAVKIKQTNWANFRKIVGNKWTPGANWPFDPIASKTAQKIGLKVAVMNGKNLDNLKAFLRGKDFKGTVIQGR